MPTARSYLKDFSPKSQDAVALQQIKERGALPMIDRGDIWSGKSTVAAISGLHCRALVVVSSSIRLTAWLRQIQRSGRNGQRDWCMSRVTAIISALVICIIVCLSWAVNYYRDNAITYKAQRDKMPENWSWRTRQLLTCRCVSVMLLRSMQKYTKELADAKAENDALRDDVAAGRRRLHIKAVCQLCVKQLLPPAWIMQPPDWQTPLNGIISPSERGWSLCKQLEGTQKYINEQCR